MATAAPSDEPTLDIREQIARIDKMQAELNKIQVEVVKAQVEVRKTEQDTKYGPLMLIFTGMGAAAAFFAAGAAFTKLIVG